MADECLKIGLCEYIVDNGNRKKAEEIAKNIASFPQECLKADRRSILKQNHLSLKKGFIMNGTIVCKIRFFLKRV